MVHFRQFVDDLVGRCEGTARLIRKWLVPAVEDLVQLLHDTDLVISFDKTYVAGTSGQLATQVHNA